MTNHPGKPKKGSTRTGRRRRKPRSEGGGTEETASALPVWPGMPGGRYQPLSDSDIRKIHETILIVLENTGLSDAPAAVIDRVTWAGGRFTEEGRLLFPAKLVEAALDGFQRRFTLHGQVPGFTMQLSGKNVHMGSGGASPSILDLKTGCYRASTLKDLYDACRLVDALSNVHFFSRSLVATDMPDLKTLDINTAYVCLIGTGKHVCVSAAAGAHVQDIARMCFAIAGSQEAFHARPFLSFNINHVTPPLRIAEDAFAVLEQAALYGIPVHANVFGQVGASSPVSLAGAVVQSMAEALAGGIFAWLVNPEAKVIFGPKPMITDLRTGGMSGGGGEQAVVMAAATQMAQFYDLPNVSIAGATDSKIADAQSGYEKCLSVCLAAHAGSNLITQACGMQASLLGCALESYVVDNDMLGGILSSLRPVEMNVDSLSAEAIDRVVRSAGHFLGEQETLARMKSDFLYPDIADRRTPAEWEEEGGKEIREVAQHRTREILSSHYPDHVDADLDEYLRRHFDIRLPSVGRDSA